MNNGDRLDALLSTSDSGFNKSMQHMIWEHTPKEKFCPDAGVIDYMEILREIFIFCLNNHKTPYACIGRIVGQVEDDDEYLLTLLDGILHLLAVSDESDSMLLLSVQLVDLRHKIAPWDEDEGVIAIMEEIELANQKIRKPAPATSVPSTSNERKNVFNSMPLDEVRQWFMQLAETSSKNGKPFLTVEQVEQFINRAFCGNSAIQSFAFNMADGERTSVTKLFYLFYNRCTNEYAIETTKHCKEKYVRLLTDNFTNYSYKTVFDTFNNSQNAPKEWKTTV